MRLSLIATLTFSLAISVQAHASVEQQLASCAAQTDKLDRLMCYDALAESVSTITTPVTLPATVASTSATEAVAPQTMSKTEVTSSAEDNFGLKKKTQKEAENVKLYAEILSIKKDPYGAITVKLSNNQTWKQIDTSRYNLKPGQTIFIEKAALGSFLLGANERNSTMRVKRLN
ncbi:hypothetical protein [Shewanella donghaensis]|uniref:hypothetical protein n=1 Tax=Shewanella donghaensis TaxID=238836 RepID=UPI001182E133|nr:hypothetical protein [Shewanella donghaensis]